MKKTLIIVLLLGLAASQVLAQYDKTQSQIKDYIYLHFRPTKAPMVVSGYTMNTILNYLNENKCHVPCADTGFSTSSGGIDSIYIDYCCDCLNDVGILETGDTIHIDTCYIKAYTNYWNYIDAAIDTLYNNVADGSAPGVVAIRGNLELETTNATATRGVIKQNGEELLHTYTDNATENNLWMGGAGNFTLTGNYNIGVGFESLKNSTSGQYNTVMGYQAGKANTSGYKNTFIGHLAGNTNTTSYEGTMVGNEAGMGGMGYANTYFGSEAGTYISGYNNVAVGYNTMSKPASTTSWINSSIAIGTDAMVTSSTGAHSFNFAFGHYAMGTFANGSSKLFNGNIMVGHQAGQNMGSASNAECDYNIGIGHEVMGGLGDVASATPFYNIAIGYRSMYQTGSGAGGDNNISIGRLTMANANGSDNNIIIGDSAGYNLTTGDENIYIGTDVGFSQTTESNKIRIGRGDLFYGETDNDSIRLQGDVAIIGQLWYEDTFWGDLTFPATSSKQGALNKPDFDYDEIALLFPYSDSTEITYYNPQMPHQWKRGTAIYPYVHYIQSGVNDTAEFVIQYRFYDMGDAVPSTWTRIETTDCTLYPYTSGDLHQLALFPAISGSGFVESAILDIKFYRKEDVGVNADVLVKELDIHYEIDKPGTNDQDP